MINKIILTKSDIIGENYGHCCLYKPMIIQPFPQGFQANESNIRIYKLSSLLSTHSLMNRLTIW